MRKLMLAGGLALAASSVVAQYRPTGPTARLTERDDGRSVQVAVGGEIRVQLTQQAGTPFSWQLRNDQHLQLIGPPTTEDQASRNIFGGPQLKTFRVRVVAPGRFPMIFGLRSSVAGGEEAPARRLLFTIDAAGPRPAPRPGPWPLPTPGGNVKVLDERDATFAVDLGGREAEIRLRTDPSSDDRWRVVSARDVTITREPRLIDNGYNGSGYSGADGITVLRAHNTKANTDGFLTLGLIPPGATVDRFSATRTIDYHFLRER